MTATHLGPADRPVPLVGFASGLRPGQFLRDAALLGGACAAGALAAAWPLAAVAACLLALLAAMVWVRPATAAYLLIGLTPLVAGIDRGEVIPFFRPNEALALVLGATLATRWVFGLRSGTVRWVRPDGVDIAVVLMAVTNSVSPLLTMAVRGREITGDDLLYSLVLWKLVGVYLIVKFSVRTAREVRVCLVISVAVACGVAVVGVLQGLDLFGVRAFLAEYYAPFGSSAAIQARPRGGSTLSLPAAAADFLIMNLAVVTGLWLRGRRYTVVFGAAVAVLIAGTLAAGEFSSTLGLLLGLVTLAVVAGSLGLLGFYAVLVVGGGLAVWPVVAERLHGFAHASGIPPSWVGRLTNLQTYFWPDLSTHGNFLLGVRPSARVSVPTQATGFVWIESGYAWLLWGGGIPLLVSFLIFVWVAGVRGWRVARGRTDAVGAAGTGAVVAVVLIAVLMVFDPHLTYRGSADVAFFLIALTTAAVPQERQRPGRHPAGDRHGSAEQRRTGHEVHG